MVRICTKTERRDLKLSELKILLLARDYPGTLSNSAIERARAVPRKKALQRIIRTIYPKLKRPAFALKYNSRLPSIIKYSKNAGD